MTIEDIIANVNGILAEGFEVDPSRLRPESQIVKDIGLDSLDVVDLVVALEKKFGFRIEETEARSMRTLKDIYDYIGRRSEGH